MRGGFRWSGTHRAVLAGPGHGPARSADAQYWVQRWRRVYRRRPTPSSSRAAGRDLARFQALQRHRRVGSRAEQLLAGTDGQVLTTLPGVAVIRAPRSPRTACLSPDTPTPSTCTRDRPRPSALRVGHACAAAADSRQGLAEHRDALMGIAWGLSRSSPSFAERDREYRSRGMHRSRPGSPSPGTPAAWPTDSYPRPFDEERIVKEGTVADGDGHVSYAARRRNLACRPSALGRLMAHTKACRSTAPDQHADQRPCARTDPTPHRPNTDTQPPASSATAHTRTHP